MKKTAVLFFYTDSRYDELAEAALNSFRKFHDPGQIPWFLINHKNKAEWDKNLKYYEAGDEIFIMQYIYAYEIMKMGYDKIISLGCDTITCGRLDEFLDNDSTDILCSLNYPKPEGTEYWQNPVQTFKMPGKDQIEFLESYQDTPNINADVVCFNNAEALKKVIDLSIEHYTYFSIQGGLNEMYCHPENHNFSMKIVDYPYKSSDVVYNARSKGVMFTNQISGNPNSPVKRFKVRNLNGTKMLLTEDNKQIKVFHYVEGLGGRPIEDFNKLINDFKYEWFNDETKQFFREECKCAGFFRD